jgi:acyl-CoA reductase-like NAD-dependent aldehyde dehydrogenase
MTVLETFRMLIDGDLVESQPVTPDVTATVWTMDIRRSRRVAAAIEAGSA